jgi:hypothetical protein
LETVPDPAAAARMVDLGDASEVNVREARGSGFRSIRCTGSFVSAR